MKTRRETMVLFGGTAAFLSGGSGAWARAETQAPADGLRRTEPGVVGVDPAAVLAFLDEMQAAGLELNSFMLYRKGAVAAEGWWWPYRPALTHMLHSSTKSFVGTGFGIAIDEGLVRLDDPVLKFFPDRIANPSENLQAMTVDSLLTQTSGHDIGISGSQWRTIKTSWVTEFLKVPVEHKPGTHFAYSSATSFMLSGIITQVTGKPFSEYLRPRLFEPMGITNYSWDVGPEGINPGGNGLSTTTADFTKLGAMLLAGGLWNDRQIVPKAWAETVGKPKHGNPYGYQWWVLPGGVGYAAAGKFGQFTYVLPALDAVFTLTSGVADNEETRNKMLAMAVKHIPTMCSGAAATAEAAARLEQRQASLRLLPPLQYAPSDLSRKISGRTFVCEDNADQVKSVRLDFTGDHAVFHMVDHRGAHEVNNGLRDWAEGHTKITGGYLHHEYEPEVMRVVAGGQWTKPNQFTMTWQFVDSGFRDTVVLSFDGDKVAYDRSVNVNSGPLARPTIQAALKA